MDQTIKKSKTPEEALSSLMSVCARREYCTADARRLMTRWGVAASEQERVIERLQRERFIDDGRYADAFVREKLKLSSWGERKITSTLRAKRIPSELIAEALERHSSREQNVDRLTTALTRKLRTVRYKDIYDLRAKLMRYGAGLGHDFDAVAECINHLLKNYDTED